jgi:hypothetical protein
MSGGTGTVSTSGLTEINTAPRGSSNASQAFQNGQLDWVGTAARSPRPRQSRPRTCGRLRNARDGWHGRRVHVLLHGGPLRERKCDCLIAAPGWQSRGPEPACVGGRLDARRPRARDQHLVCRLGCLFRSSVDNGSSARRDQPAGRQKSGRYLGGFSYTVSGAVAAKNGFAGADFFLSVTVAPPGPADSKGGAARVTASGQTENLSATHLLSNSKSPPVARFSFRRTLTRLAAPRRRSPAFPAPTMPI